ncbi:MAG: hypothetical protein Q3980_15295 [Turicibacter sp.]|nr:hypothetical protein [Turicibacter sp.]
MEVLKDEQLEEIGLIKEIDTLKLIQSANLIKQRQQRQYLKLLIGLLVISCVVAQVLIFRWIGFNKEVLALGGIYLLISSVVLLIVRYKEIENL